MNMINTILQVNCMTSFLKEVFFTFNDKIQVTTFCDEGSPGVTSALRRVQ